jgi:hypothetical protein
MKKRYKKRGLTGIRFTNMTVDVVLNALRESNMKAAEKKAAQRKELGC